MLNGKQRAYLRSIANTIDTILIIGKGGITQQVIKQADDALTAREIIKGKVLENSDLTSRQAADMLGTVNAEAINAHLDEASVAFAQILIYSGILGVEVNTVCC